MKLKEAGNILRMHSHTVQRKVKSGQIKANMVDGHWEITQEYLQEYLNKYDTNFR